MVGTRREAPLQQYVVDSTLSGAVAGATAARAAARPGDSTSRGGAATAANQISIDNFTFMPPTLIVIAGTAVTWVNRDDVPHLIASTDKRLHPRRCWTRMDITRTRSPSRGTYAYYCAIHPKMTGTITVK